MGLPSQGDWPWERQQGSALWWPDTGWVCFLWVFLTASATGEGWAWTEGGRGAGAAWLAGAGHPNHLSPGSGSTSGVTWDPEGPAHDFVLSAVLKLLKMAVGMRALLDTVMQALPQVARRWEWA